MPLQRTALELLAETGPLAVSSANISGQPPATSAKMALEQLGESVSIYLEMGETTSDIPSTIVDATSDKLQIIRLGALSKADLVEIVGSRNSNKCFYHSFWGNPWWAVWFKI
jgi:tRNA A37 threonylcarbamoyladenosine synthetase subunit TsaC/SUA5/YrdC